MSTRTPSSFDGDALRGALNSPDMAKKHPAPVARPVPFSVVILAAGQGKRMKSALPKVLQPLAGRPLLKHVIDTASFRFLDLLYWSDRRRVYGFNPMSDGGTVYYIAEADPHSFRALEASSPYAKDKKNVFYKGSIIPGADVKSFVIIKDSSIPELARDKSTWYFLGEPLTESELSQMRSK